jgi:hypothetical protein
MSPSYDKLTSSKPAFKELSEESQMGSRSVDPSAFVVLQDISSLPVSLVPLFVVIDSLFFHIEKLVVGIDQWLRMTIWSLRTALEYEGPSEASPGGLGGSPRKRNSNEGSSEASPRQERRL